MDCNYMTVTLLHTFIKSDELYSASAMEDMYVTTFHPEIRPTFFVWKNPIGLCHKRSS